MAKTDRAAREKAIVKPRTEAKANARIKTKVKDIRLFTFDVYLMSGRMTEKFVEKNPVVCRTIQIRGDQMLVDLHFAIFDSFDREEEHMYEFQIGGKRPNDKRGRRYALPMAMDDPFDDPENADRDLTCTTIDSLGLRRRQVFFYWFDYGDDWWHRIEVSGIDYEAPAGKYPKVTNRVGASPPQYLDWG